MKYLLICICYLFLSNTQASAQKYSEEAKNYFKEIALGSEYGNSQDKTIKKWAKDIHLFIPTTTPDYLKLELDKIIEDLNALISPLKIHPTNQQAKANLVLYLGNSKEYIKAEPRARKLVAGNLGLFYVYPNHKGEIERGTVFLDTERLKAKDTQRHFLREEVTQALGLMNDSDKYPNSIFYQKWSRTNTFSDLDKEVIRILYSSNIKGGQNAYEANNVLNSM